MNDPSTAALPTLVTCPVKFALVVTVEALPVKAPTNVVQASELVAELYVREALVFGPRSPVAAVKNATKQVVSVASFATVISTGVEPPPPPPVIETRATPPPMSVTWPLENSIVVAAIDGVPSISRTVIDEIASPT